MSDRWNRLLMVAIAVFAMLYVVVANALFILLPSTTVTEKPVSVDVVATNSEVSSLDHDDYFDIGPIHYPITTCSPEAQEWFDRGLAMCHGFNHEEAIRCFELAIQADPGCALAYWGMAYAWGPNINSMLVDPSLMSQAVLALRMAKLHTRNLQDWERDLIEATTTRYVTPAPKDCGPLNHAYADALRVVYKKHAKQRMIVALMAEALMDLRPWKLWSPDGTPAPETPEIVEVLEYGLKHWPDDPMLCHLYIHTIEASPHPEKALAAADRLRNNAASLGHLVHMPSHIDVRLGRYDSMIEANQKAIAADQRFVEKRGRSNFYTIYRIHNLHFLTYGAMFTAQQRLAIESSRQLSHEIPEELLAAHSDLLDPFLAVPLHALIRFGKWEQILAVPKPADRLPLCQAMWHYARGIAFAATNRVTEAEKEQSQFEEARTLIPDTSQFHNNSSREIAKVGQAMLDGEIAYRKGEFEKAFATLRLAVERDDRLSYDEPWGWMQPTRHALGALLSEQGRFQEAESVYREDLKRHPDNVWSLQGLTECLEHRRSPEAIDVRARFQKAASHSDVIVNRACMCRQRTREVRMTE